MNRQYLPSLSELIDRLSIIQLKEVFIPDHKDEYSEELKKLTMSEGKILQYGSPREIYHNPQNKFVANFIGESNFLSANIDNDKAILSDGTVLPLSKNRSRSHAGQRSILIRPEHVHMSPLKSSKGSFEGTIDNIVYFGTDTLFHLVLNSGEPFTVRKQNSPEGVKEFELGTRVELKINENAIQTLDD